MDILYQVPETLEYVTLGCLNIFEYVTYLDLKIFEYVTYRVLNMLYKLVTCTI